ncbi:integrase [Alsobacter soli]|uniref:Integrase n=2 Tax=Alsobacter soli TaxID=2109933 RepID=A0A2T1HX00_9HYPH|nr:integrase [Alsobacter soli]
MARVLHRLTARQVETLGAGRHSDGGGLYLERDGEGRSRWLFFWTANGKRREMGLGRAGKGGVTLHRARELAAEARMLVKEGKDPIEERRKRQAESATDTPRVPTFGEVADAFIAGNEASWRNPKHRQQWRNTLRDYCGELRARPVNEITTADVLAVLQPIWLAKPETASRLRGRMERVLAAATAQGHRSGPNPAAWRNHLDTLLPPRHRLSRGHHGAMPYAELRKFVTRLHERGGISCLALEFLVLTAARTGEVLGATWAEIDFDRKLWIVTPGRMKAGKEHRVPLAPRAVEILREMAKLGGDAASHIFPGRRSGGGLSNMALDMLVRRLGLKERGLTVHGFRSSFRDWAGEETEFAREVIEAALAHVVGDRTERAYRRGDALEKRRKLMEAWAAYCALPTTQKPGRPDRTPPGPLS